MNSNMRDSVADCKLYRDEYLANGNKFMAAYYQASILYRLNLSGKKTDLQWKLMAELLGAILGFWDEEYFRGILYELIIAGIPEACNNMNITTCHNYFCESAVKQYVHEAYCLHISCIQGIAAADGAEAAEGYEERLLKLLEIGYGMESAQYAKMKLHILGEFEMLVDKEKSIKKFVREFGYFRSYLTEYAYFAACCIDYADELEGKDYEDWMKSCGDMIEKYFHDKDGYQILKCQYARLEAVKLKKRGFIEEAAVILSDAIDKYFVVEKKYNKVYYSRFCLDAADVFFNVQDYNTMYEMASRGVEIYEEGNLKDNELYYKLKNFLGIKLITDNDLNEAIEFYSRGLREILENCRDKREVYQIYLNQVCIIYMAELRFSEARLYIEQLEYPSSEQLTRLDIQLLTTRMRALLGEQNNVRKAKGLYEKYIAGMQSEEYKENRIQFQTAYFLNKIMGYSFDSETDELAASLGFHYKERYDEWALSYKSSMIFYKWSKGDMEDAFRVAGEIIGRMGEDDYWRNQAVIIAYIQLLLLHNRYAEAEKLALYMAGRFCEEIWNMGLEDISALLLNLRVVLSLYIASLNLEEKGFSISYTEIKNLLGQIMFCKTIEKEFLSVLRKSKNKDVPWRKEINEYGDIRRKIAALEIKMRLAVDNDGYAERSYQYDMKKAELENLLRELVPFEELIEGYTLEETKIPDDAICVEYFAYFTFGKEPYNTIWDEENDNVKYLAFVLGKLDGKTQILHIYSFAEEYFGDLYDMVQDHGYDDAKYREIVKKYKDMLVNPLYPYLQGIYTVYLGVDYMLQQLPVDTVFEEFYRESRTVILVDSVRYARQDRKIDISKADAVVMGNAKYNIKGSRQKISALKYSGMECKQIAEILKTEAYLGENAKQKILWNEYQKDIIHISTHGYMDIKYLLNPSEYNKSIVQSFILLAGFEDWRNHAKLYGYGNGVVTGEDILFMDLSKTKLAVLSACYSGYELGMGLVHGLRWALGAAGARNSVTALWEVEDCVSAVLMVLFYRNLRTLPVGKALMEAKKKMQSITVEELRRDDALWEIARDKCSNNPQAKPFSAWYNWAGFVLYCG